MEQRAITAVLDHPTSRDLLARLAYVAADGTPRSIPIGYTWNGTQIVMCTPTNAPKVTALRRNPAVALTIDTEEHPPKILLVRGRAELETVDGFPDEFVVTPTWAKLIDFETTLPSAVEELARERAGRA